MKEAFDKKKILIVDDSEINRSLLSDMLADEYEIIEAENGMEASAILHEHEQDISLNNLVKLHHLYFLNNNHFHLDSYKYLF